MATVKTRSETEHGILGQPRPFQTNQLPTSADVFKAYDYLLKNNNCASVTERATVIANEIKALYNKASIPTIAVSSLVIRIKRLINKVHELGKYSDRKKSSATFKSSLQMLDQLFDICLCKCFNKGVRERSACSCPLPKKIPTLEWEFWIDQKTVRKMVIGKVDKEETIKLQKREKRGSKTCNLPITDKKMKFDKEIDPNETYCSDNEQSKPDEEFLPIEMSDGKVMSSYEVMSSDNEMSSDEEMKVYNTKQYPELCKAMDRCKISNRDACLIANAVLKDLDLITPENAIDPAKLRRQRNMWREKEVKKHAAEVQKILCIGFDGKQDITSVKTSGVQRNFKEEHYVIVSFPQNKYVNHVTPQSSKAVDIAQEILLSINNIKSSDTLAAVVCDGSVNNTGQHNGVIRKLEEGLGRTLQWLVCLLHANELPFRKYFSVVDGGRSTGPATSTGKIDIALDFDPKDLDIVNFKHIPGKVEDVSVDVKKDLSSDQIYLLKACLAVQQGYTACDQILFLQTAMPGNLNHARWLTKANRILRLYMSKENPSKPLQRITRFIVNVYAPSWFNIKRHSSCLDGARNFFYLMKQCYELGKEEWKILEPVHSGPVGGQNGKNFSCLILKTYLILVSTYIRRNLLIIYLY